MQAVAIHRLPAEQLGVPCEVELPFEARVVEFDMMGQTSTIAGPNGQPSTTFGPAVRILHDPYASLVTRRFVIAEMGAMLPDDAVYVASAAGMLPTRPRPTLYNFDLFELPLDSAWAPEAEADSEITP